MPDASKKPKWKRDRPLPLQNFSAAAPDLAPDLALCPSRSDPKKNRHPEPMSQAERDAVMGRPEEWGSWWVWLRIHLKNDAGKVSAAIDKLNNALRQGMLVAKVHGEPVDRGTWFEHSLCEPNCEAELVVVAAAGGRSALQGKTITVRRDDLRKLRAPSGTAPPAPKGAAGLPKLQSAFVDWLDSIGQRDTAKKYLTLAGDFNAATKTSISEETIGRAMRAIRTKAD